MTTEPVAQDTRAILDVLHAYCHTLDGGDAAGCADCFTDDGVWEAVWTDGSPVEGHRFCGRDELEAYFGRIVVEHPAWSQHHLVNDARVHVDGDGATVESYFTTVLAGAPPQLGAVGRYVDRLARGADGRWRFTVRTIVARRP